MVLSSEQKQALSKKLVCPLLSREEKGRRRGSWWAPAPCSRASPGALRGAALGDKGPVQGHLVVSASLCLGRKQRCSGQRRERNSETAQQQTNRWTSPRRDTGARPQHRHPAGCGRGVYLVCNSSRAFLPQPQGRGHVFQHLKHIIVTDAPTGGPAHRTEAEWGPRWGAQQEGRGRKQTRKQSQLYKE